MRSAAMLSRVIFIVFIAMGVVQVQSAIESCVVFGFRFTFSWPIFCPRRDANANNCLTHSLTHPLNCFVMLNQCRDVDEVSSPSLFQIEGVIKLPRPESMASSRILLNGGAYSTIPRSDGSFVFYGVPVGTYLLEVNNVPYLFETLRLDVSAHEGGGRIKAAPLTRRERLPYPLLLRPVVEAQYFQVCTIIRK
jgi:hypothetical protein